MTIPGSANPLLLASAAAEPTAYEIERSVRFNSADSAYLSRTPSTAGNRKTWTLAGWVKKTEIGSASNRYLLNALSGSARTSIILLGSGDKLQVDTWNGSSYSFQLITTQVFRDPSAWFHLTVAVDTTDGTQGDRVKIFVNGTRVSAFDTSSYPSSAFDTYVNTTSAHYVGAYDASNNQLNGYLADIHFIDGGTPSTAIDSDGSVTGTVGAEYLLDFGEFDADTGVWNPKAYTGSYNVGAGAVNGFHLDFSDNSTAAALGTDTSGNSNTWTVNNISVAAGAGNDSLVDVPTNGTETDTGVGGEVRGNYCTLNPLITRPTVTLANGNLDMSGYTSLHSVYGTIGIPLSGKWYYEYIVQSNAMIGIAGTPNGSQYPGQAADAYAWDPAGGGGFGYIYNNGSNTSYATASANDTVGCAFDADNGTLVFYKNGVSQGTAFSSIPSKTYFPIFRNGSTNTSVNFGQRPFAYTAPSGFKALCTANLPAPLVTKPSEYMDVVTYTGNGGTQTISGLDFSPDLVWIKSRVDAFSHRLQDTVRGVKKELISDGAGAEYTYTVEQGLTAFNSDGFTLIDGATANGTYNKLNSAFVAWTWDAGSSTVSNTDGSITSSVRANASAGFSIVTYTGVTGNQSFGHGLGVKPKLIMIKNRSNAANWFVMVDIGTTYYKYGHLNTTDQFYDATAQPVSNTTVTLGNNNAWFGANGDNYVAYCFAPVDGYSSFGSYTGNGSADGPFVFTGMRPRWILFKNTNAGENWRIMDAARNTYNVVNGILYPNLSNAEGTSAVGLDILSNGFKIRETGSELNASGATIIYAAFAESPVALNNRAR